MDSNNIFRKFHTYRKKLNLHESSKGKSRNQHKQSKHDSEEYYLSSFKNISETEKIFGSILKRSISQNINETSDKSGSFLVKNQLLKNIKEYYLQEDKTSNKTIYSRLSKNKIIRRRRSISNGLIGMRDFVSDLSNPSILIRTKSYNRFNKNLTKSDNSKGNKINKKLFSRVKSKNKEYISNSEYKNDNEVLSSLSDNKNIIHGIKKNERNYIISKSSKKSLKISNEYSGISSRDYKNFPESIRMSKSLKSINKNNNGYNFPIFFNIGNPKISKKYMNSSTLISNILDKSYHLKDNNCNSSFFKQKNKNKILNDKKSKFKNKDNKFSSRLCIRNFKNKKMSSQNNLNYKKPNTIILTGKLNQNNLLSILRTNKPSEMKNDTSKIMNIIAMDEVNKKIKESLVSIDKTELRRELYDLETSEICQVIEKLPVINNNSNIDESNSKILDNENKEDKKIEFVNTNFKLSKFRTTKYNDRHRFLKRKTMIYDSLDDEEIEDVETNSMYISPDSFIVNLIDSIIFICSFIELFYLPIYIAKKLDFCRNIRDLREIMFYLIDIFYIIDLISEFFRAYYNFDEFLIKKTRYICIRYFKSWFFTDLIEAIPLYIIFSTLEKKCETNNKSHSKFYNLDISNRYYNFHILKMLKIFKVFSKNATLKKLKKITNDIEFFFQFRTVLFTLLIFISSLNITSCLFILCGRNSYPGWIIECDMQNNSFFHIYIAAIYYIMTTVTTVGYGDLIITSIHERIFQIIFLIFGTCAYSWIVTYISNNIQKIQEKYLDYEQKMSILKEIKISNPYLTKNLYDKICRYLQYSRIEQKSKNKNEIIINCLPYPLKNALLMDMYKPIIKNFNIFKSFENQNFIVKVVTSFQPVLSVEGDVLIQEGDFVEDIIFVKEGVVSLEVCLDLEYPQEYIEAYLKETGFGKSNYNNKKFKKSNISNSYIQTFNNSLIPSSTIKNKIDDINENENKKIIDFDRSEFEENKKYIKIIDIRKNEHFGSILMFLNERAPFRVKVKSKKAEIYLLNKTDAIEISTLYPNIWKRIMKKSLFNMEQIRNLARKLLFSFSQRNGIILNEDLFYNNNNNITTTSISKLDEDDLNNKSKFDSERDKSDENSNFKENSEKQLNGEKKLINSIIYEEENENNESFANTFINKKEKNASTMKNNLYNKTNSKNSKFSQSSLKNSINDSPKSISLFKKTKIHKIKLSKNNIEFTQSEKLKIHNDPVDLSIQSKEGNNSDNLLNHNFNSFLLTDKCKSLPKENKRNIIFEKEDSKNSEKTEKIKRNESNFNINDSDDLDFQCLTPFKKEEVNWEIYPNEVFNQNHFLKTEQLSIQPPEKLSDKNNGNNLDKDNSVQFIDKHNSNNDNKKDLINFTDSQINSQNEKELFEKNSNDDSINSNKNKKNINVCCSPKINKENECKIFHQQSSSINKYFNNLSITNTFSTTINSSYNNFNLFTKCQFSKDTELQLKTFRFIKEECLHFVNSLNKANNDPLIKQNLYINNKKKKNIYNHVSISPKLKPKRSRKEGEFLSVVNKEEKINSSFSSLVKKRVCKSPKKDRTKLIHLNSSSSHASRKAKKDSVIIRLSNLISDNDNNNYDVSNNIEKKCNEKKLTKNNTSNHEDTELNFYGKMKTLRGSNIKGIAQNTTKNKRKMTYMDLISNNINKNRQTLNNPQEFYTGLFTDIVQKQKK